jgi:hypothetical protein
VGQTASTQSWMTERQITSIFEQAAKEAAYLVDWIADCCWQVKMSKEQLKQ